MNVLRVGSRGTGVKQLQEMLADQGLRVRADGVFGPATDRAVRTFQRRSGTYPPDGVVRRDTLEALKATACKPDPYRTLPPMGWPASPKPTLIALRFPDAPGPNRSGPTLAAAVPPVAPGPLSATVAASRSWATYFPDLFDLAAPPTTLHLSLAGRTFIIQEETQPGVSNRLHHPSDASGVTLGPGYDMKGKTAKTITDDLVAIDVDPDIAAKVAKASGLSGAAADSFKTDNRNLINLTDNQQSALLVSTVGRYEEMVQRHITRPLHDYEFDAMISFAYNPGGGWHTVTHAINEGRYHDAMVSVSHQVHSGSKVMTGLVKRREREINLFLYGKYK